MLRSTLLVAPSARWPTRAFVRSFFGSGHLVGKDGILKPNYRSRDDERIDQTSYSDAFDESDALEMEKQKKDVGSNENKDTSVAGTPWMSRLADQLSFWKSFNSDWLLQQPRGNAFAPFYFGGRDPFVFHDTFLPVLLAQQKGTKKTRDARKTGVCTYTLSQTLIEQADGWMSLNVTPGRRPGVVSCYDDTVQTNFSDAFDESDWAESGKQKKAAC